MAKYTLVKGKHQSIDSEGNRVNNAVGDVVELSQAQYEAFKDKFEPVEEKKVEPPKQEPKAAPTK